MPGSYTPPPVAGGGGGDTRTNLTAGSDRAGGLWDPSITSNFDNTDLSVIVLEIPDPGNWLVGWEGYVRASGAVATAEVDVALSDLGEADPLNNAEYLSSGQAYVSTAADIWLQSISFITVTDPKQIAALVYAATGAIRARQSEIAPFTPRLFAWPV